MYTPRQIWQRVTPKAQLLIALSLATILAFSAGLASAIYGRATVPLTQTTDHNAVPAAAQPPAAAPAAAPVALAARNPNVPIIGTGSAYDGGAYGAVRPAAHNPNLPVLGTGSAYDGGAYGITRPTTRTWPGVPVAGTGLVYDGGHYTSAPTVRKSNMPISGTGSAYDGQ